MANDPSVDAELAHRHADDELILGPVRRSTLGALDRKIADHLARHIESESELLTRYERVGTDSEAAFIRYLAGLILDDERRHHRLLTEMMNRLDSDAALRELPQSTPRVEKTRSPELRRLTKELLRSERRDARELRELKRDLKSRRDTTLFGLLVDLMELDTKKHLQILKFIRAHLDD